MNLVCGGGFIFFKVRFEFLLSPTNGSEKIVLGDQILEIKLLQFLYVLRLAESKNHVLSGWSACVCMCMYVSLRVSVSSMNKKQIMVGIPISVF